MGRRHFFLPISDSKLDPPARAAHAGQDFDFVSIRIQMPAWILLKFRADFPPPLLDVTFKAPGIEVPCPASNMA
jgi:hypothetical protein